MAVTAAYNFDEGSGTTAADSTGNGHTLTAVGSPWDAAGHTGSAAGRSPGAAEYFTSANGFGPNVSASNYSVMFWVYCPTFTGTPSDTYTCIVTDSAFFIEIQSNAGANGVVDLVFGGPALFSPSPISAAAWHHIAGTRNSTGSVMTMYIDGSSVATGTGTAYNFGVGSWWIGNAPGSEQGIDNIRIDDFRVFDTCLTSTEVNTWMGTPVTPAAVVTAVHADGVGAGVPPVTVGVADPYVDVYDDAYVSGSSSSVTAVPSTGSGLAPVPTVTAVSTGNVTVVPATATGVARTPVVGVGGVVRVNATVILGAQTATVTAVRATAVAASMAPVVSPTTVIAVEKWTGTDGLAWPAQWTTETVGTALDTQGNQGRMVTQAGGFTLGPDALLTSMTPAADVDVTVSLTMGADNDYYADLCARMNGGFSGGNPVNGYALIFHGSGPDMRIRRTVAGAYVDLITVTPLTVSPGMVVRLRLQLIGTQINAKAWNSAGAEPGAWNISYVDPTPYLTAGTVGLTVFNGSALVHTLLWDDLVVAQSPIGIVQALRATGTAVAGVPVVTGLSGSASVTAVRATATAAAPVPVATGIVAGVSISGTSIKKNGVTWQPRGGAIPIWTMGNTSKTVQGINLALNCGADIVRFTDYLDTNGVAGVAEFDETHWVALDLAIAKASTAGLYIELDFAAYRNLLFTQAAGTYNPYSAAALTGWHTFLTWAANRVNTFTGNTYKTEPMIVLVSFAGETDPPGSTVGLAHGYTSPQLVTFYDDVMTFWHGLAPKHLRIPGGLFHFSDATLPWQSIFSLASCDLPATHEYSTSDESYEPTMQTLCTGLGKPWIVEEFGIVRANYANDTVRAADFTRQYNVALTNNADGILVWGMDPTALDPVTDPLTLAAVRAVSNVTHTGGTYRYFRISFSAVRTGGNNLQIAEWTLMKGAATVPGMLVTATNSTGNSYESPICASDLDTSSKWNNASGVPCSLTYDLGFTTAVDGYRITTANDSTGRDPAAWVVAGSTNGTTWTTLDTQAAPTVPLGRLTNTAVFPI